MLTLVVVVALAAAAAVPGAKPVHGPCGWRAKPPARWRHVVWIWMENESYDQVIGKASGRYLTQLAHVCGVATNYAAVSHPSLPNYIAATSGSTWGIADDDPPAAHPIARPSIFSQVSAAGLSWRSYEESMPSNCALSSAGLYAVKHNPAAYYTGLRAQCGRWDVPMGTLSSGLLASALRRGRLPSFAFVTPNLCDDMHDCSIATGDAWLRRWISAIITSESYRSGTTAIFITFDEGSGSNHVATLVVAPSTPSGTRSSTPFNHYSLLKTTEQLLGVRGRLAHAGDPSTRGMRAAFHL
ncbi:MAG: alkaline phosphatase family protein [Gaiellaceae bacterium]